MSVSGNSSHESRLRPLPSLDEIVRDIGNLQQDLDSIRKRLADREVELFARLTLDLPHPRDLRRHYGQAHMRGIEGWYARWREAGLPNVQALRSLVRRTLPEGKSHWTGSIPFDRDQTFPLGPVAFEVWSDDNKRLLVGSTGNFRNRIRRLVDPWD